MQRLSFVALCAMVIGCKSSSPGANPAPTCAPVLEGALDRMMADAKTGMPPESFARVVAMAPRMKAAIVDSCTANKWSAEVLGCMSAAKSQADINACADQLTPEQKASYEAASAAAFMKGRTQ